MPVQKAFEKPALRLQTVQGPFPNSKERISCLFWQLGPRGSVYIWGLKPPSQLLPPPSLWFGLVWFSDGGFQGWEHPQGSPPDLYLEAVCRGRRAGQYLLGLSLPFSVHLWGSAGSWAPNERGVLGESFCALVVLLGAKMAAGRRKPVSGDSPSMRGPQGSSRLTVCTRGDPGLKALDLRVTAPTPA